MELDKLNIKKRRTLPAGKGFPAGKTVRIN